MTRAGLRFLSLVAAVLAGVASAPLLAQEHEHEHPQEVAPPQEPEPVVDHSQMDHSQMDHSQHTTGEPPAAARAAAAAAQPRTPIPVLTDADRAAAFPELHHRMSHGSGIHAFLLVDRLEAWDGDDGNGQGWELQGWLGGDINRVWLRSEGEREAGRTHAADVEVLYGRAVSAWWDVVAGVRQQTRPGDAQTWAAIGVQGLAPYMFETQATAYLGESGQVEAVVEVEYELLLTNRLVLQPLLELAWHGEDDPRLGEPLCPACYDSQAQVLWNALAPELWRRTTIAVNRYVCRLARQRGIPYVPVVSPTTGKVRMVPPVRVPAFDVIRRVWRSCGAERAGQWACER